MSAGKEIRRRVEEVRSMKQRDQIALILCLIIGVLFILILQIIFSSSPVRHDRPAKYEKADLSAMDQFLAKKIRSATPEHTGERSDPIGVAIAIAGKD